MMKKLLLSIQVVGLSCVLFAQGTQTDAPAVALDYLRSQQHVLGLEPGDISGMRLTDVYTSKHNNVTHVYFVQQYQGVDIASATYALHLQKGKVLHTGDRLVRDVDSQIQSGSRTLSPEDAVSKTLTALGNPVRSQIAVKERLDANRVVIDRGAMAHQDIPVRLVYTESGSGLKLAWEVVVEPANSGDLWSVEVDASTGNILKKELRTIYCIFPEHYLASPHDCAEHDMAGPALLSPLTSLAGDGAQYNVVVIPDESPKHGDRQMLLDPADVDASPMGWHDTDGVEGAEFTITRGNNVHAFLDRDGDAAPDSQVDGGADLIFDFPFDILTEPTDYQPAAVTNLFYMNNVMHDFAFQYGFDEFSGNFQQTNHTGLGVGGDAVAAHAQYGADQADPPLNNATFSTPADGGSGRMRMYLWSQSGANQLLRVETPPDVAGYYATATTATNPAWGGLITDEPLTGEVVFVNDASGSPTQGCNALVNGAEVEGKIAMIDRGDCEFGLKALNAQNAGAIGFIICNFEEGLVTMGAGAVGEQVTIPGVFIANSDCQKIRAFAGNGLEVSFVNEQLGTGPDQRDGSIDNSVIAHEYGHGISNRLTGGPSQAGCLNNYDNDNDGDPEDGEQMGEGWSDFFALVTTVRPGDTKETPRGIATYSSGQETNGVGLRSYRYSPDMVVNPLTYDDIAFQSVPHGIGTVWCSALWDLYWRLVDEYGYDPDLYKGTGGNNLAIQLVMDGMKMQPCDPGLIDGRDAILAADMALTGGANQKLIWEVFARRGMGWSAEQGGNDTRLDNTEAFDVSPYVIKELKVRKNMTPWIEAGDEIEIELLVINHKEEGVTGVSLSDVIPSGATFIAGSASHTPEVNGDMIVFDVGDIASGDTTTVTYRVSTDPANLSELYFMDDVEGDFYWDVVIEDWPIGLWLPQSFVVYEGDVAWAVENIDTTSDQSLQLIEPILLPSGSPALFFYHNYQTERFFDAGIVQVSEDGGLSWNTPDVDKIVRGDFTGKVPYSLFAIPRLKAWHGESNGWVRSVVDLGDYAGKEVLLRFRFGSDGNTNGVGWFIDNIEVVDMLAYNSEACVSSFEGDAACAEADHRGAIVEAGVSVSTTNPEDNRFDLNVFPNPTRNFVTVSIASKTTQKADILLINNAGQVIHTDKVNLPAGNYSHSIDTRQLPDGFYFVKVEGERDQGIRKIVVQ